MSHLYILGAKLGNWRKFLGGKSLFERFALCKKINILNFEREMGSSAVVQDYVESFCWN